MRIHYIVKPLLRNRSEIVSITLSYLQYETISEEIHKRTLGNVQRGSEELSPDAFCLGAENRKRKTIQSDVERGRAEDWKFQQPFSK